MSERRVPSNAERGIGEDGKELEGPPQPGREMPYNQMEVGEYVPTTGLNRKEELEGLTAAKDNEIHTEETAKKTAEVLRELQLQREQRESGTEQGPEQHTERREAA